jgi:hypothetical protein
MAGRRRWGQATPSALPSIAASAEPPTATQGAHVPIACQDKKVNRSEQVRDVLTQRVRPGAIAEKKFPYEKLRELNKGLIYAPEELTTPEAEGAVYRGVDLEPASL